INYNERPLEAQQNGCNVYLAIHSNAGSSSASGAVAFYHPSQPVGKTLATNITKELALICPIKSTRSTPVLNGMLAFHGSGYGEIRSPYQHGLTPVLAETDFHDNPKTARWIIDNTDAIAKAYVAALVATFNIARKDTPAKPNPPTTGKLYRVQVGAYAVKANADAMLAKVKSAGFSDAFIKYSE
ncbi:MAG: N-acetylmuramoyl-L-alanine amidase, partial [Ruthenibacterium sp.]